MPGRVVSLLYLNPPYDFEIGQQGNSALSWCSWNTPAPVVLTNRGIPLDEVEDLLSHSSAYRQVSRVLIREPNNVTGRPLTPLHGGHVSLLATAGMLNGVFGALERCVQFRASLVESMSAPREWYEHEHNGLERVIESICDRAIS